MNSEFLLGMIALFHICTKLNFFNVLFEVKAFWTMMPCSVAILYLFAHYGNRTSKMYFVDVETFLTLTVTKCCATQYSGNALDLYLGIIQSE
jgi:hypothetical protein